MSTSSVRGKATRPPEHPSPQKEIDPSGKTCHNSSFIAKEQLDADIRRSFH
jgi:hypothetical protein